MKTMYMIFAGVVFLFFCMFEMRGVTMDRNQTAPKPDIYTSRGSGGGSRGGSSFFYFSSK